MIYTYYTLFNFTFFIMQMYVPGQKFWPFFQENTF